MKMRAFVAVCLLTTLSFSQSSEGQPAVSRALQSGDVQHWGPTRITYAYELPEPVGIVELTFSFTPAERLPPGGSRTLSSARITYGDYGAVDLPGLLLSCLRSPRTKEASVSTVYIERQAETDEDSDWFSRFTTYVNIPFGPVRPAYMEDDMDVLIPGSVEFAITGDELRRIAFIRASGERRVLQYEGVIDSCPVEIFGWMMGQARPDGSLHSFVQERPPSNAALRLA